MPNRYLCDVLEEMRVANKTRNYSYLKGLIEEVQVIGNRMEAGLYDKLSYFELQKEISKLKNDRNALKQQVETLTVKKKTLQSQISQTTKKLNSSNTNNKGRK